MIVGIGTDRVLIARVEQLVARWGERFVRRVLGPSEQAEFFRRMGQPTLSESVFSPNTQAIPGHAVSAASSRTWRAVSYLAKRFAAKEAVGKALGCGLAHPMSLHSLEVLNGPRGAPFAVFHKALAAYVAQHSLRIMVSLSDEQDAALAFALVESDKPLASS